MPTSTVETAFADQYPAVKKVWLPTGDKRVVCSVSGAINGNVYLECPVLPGSVEVAGYKDNALGQLIGSGSVLGIDYAAGVISGVNQYGLSVTAIPASCVSAASCSAITKIDNTTQGTSFAPFFTPKPCPGSLTVSYRAQGDWYVLTDNGNGQLLDEGGVSRGSLTPQGSAVITLPAEPDVGSAIVYQWAPADGFEVYGGVALGTPVTPAEPPDRAQSLEVGTKNLKPGTVVITWDGGSSNDVSGSLSGALAGGRVDYANGVILLPKNAPVKTYHISAQAFSGLTLQKSLNIDSNAGKANGSLDGAVQAGTVRMMLQLAAKNTDTLIWGGKELQANRITVAQAQIVLTDNGQGGLLYNGVNVGTVDYATGLFQVTLSGVFSASATAFREATVIANPPTAYAVIGTITAYAIDGSAATFVRDGATTSVSTDVGNFASRFNVLAGVTNGTRAMPDSWVFQAGGTRIIERGGVLYTAIDPKTGKGTIVGSLDLASGAVALSQPFSGSLNVLAGVYARGQANFVTLYFRTPAAPVKPASLTVYARNGSDTYTGQAQADESISGTLKGRIDTVSGLVELSGLPVPPETLRYNVVSQSYTPLDVSLIGIDAVKLPPDGRVPIYRRGDMIVITQKQTQTLGSAFTANQTVSLGRADIDRAVILDAANHQVDAAKYRLDLDAGTLTWAEPLDLSAYTLPLSAITIREEENRVIGADIAGRLKLQFAVARNYPKGSTFVSSALIGGDMLVRASEPFSQQAWDNVWRDERSGNPILAKLNVKDYPIRLISAGAITERWLIRFETGANTFRLYGESLGLVAESDLLSDLAPVNPGTGKPYFTLPRQAFGGGWAVGNCVRFNTYGTPLPVWILRSVQPSPTAQKGKDGFTGCLRGNTTEV